MRNIWLSHTSLLIKAVHSNYAHGIISRKQYLAMYTDKRQLTISSSMRPAAVAKSGFGFV